MPALKELGCGRCGGSGISLEWDVGARSSAHPTNQQTKGEPFCRLCCQMLISVNFLAHLVSAVS